MTRDEFNTLHREARCAQKVKITHCDEVNAKIWLAEQGGGNSSNAKWAYWFDTLARIRAVYAAEKGAKRSGLYHDLLAECAFIRSQA